MVVQNRLFAVFPGQADIPLDLAWVILGLEREGVDNGEGESEVHVVEVETGASVEIVLVDGS